LCLFNLISDALQSALGVFDLFLLLAIVLLEMLAMLRDVFKLLLGFI